MEPLAVISQTRTKLIRRLADRKGRARESQILVEGVRSAEEVLAAKLEVGFGVVSPGLERTERGRVLLATLQDVGIELLHTTDPELSDLADTERPQGVLLVCGEPSPWDPIADEPAALSPILVADAIQDPGNLGTLARTAWAFGFAGLIALDGTVDPWNPKCVRAAAGALFHMGVRSGAWLEVGPWLKERNVQILAGVGAGSDVAAVDPEDRWALVIGNEGQGVRPEILQEEAVLVSVPMKDGSESLNAAVAGAILMYSLAGRSA